MCYICIWAKAVPTPRVAMPEYILVRNYLDRIHDNSDFDDDETDEYQACLTQKTLKQKSTNLFNWWINKAEEWPAWPAWPLERRGRESLQFYQMLVTGRRSNLRVETIEANECLRSWIMQGLFGEKPPQEL